MLSLATIHNALTGAPLAGGSPVTVARAAKPSGALTVRKVDDELRLVWGEVYSPNRPDAHGDFMPPDELRKMAHRFLADGLQNSIDVMHDNDTSNGCHVVESFVSRDDDPVFIPQSWVVCLHVPEDDLWGKVKSGEFSGFSMQANVVVEAVEIEVEFEPVVKGVTEPDATGHTHPFIAHMADDGRFMGGTLGPAADGHTHALTPGSMTKTTENAGHRHRVSLIEGVQIVD